MADDDFAGDDGFYFGEDDFLYVEDEVTVADELAETQVQSPGYSGNNGEVEAESWEYDLYNYWDEVEYGDDTYWDSEIRHLDGQDKAQRPAVRAGAKRKQETSQSTGSLSNKRRKIAGSGKGSHQAKLEGPDAVVYIPFGARKIRMPPKLEKKTAVAYALLPDWKERFANDKGAIGRKDMPADMKEAAQATAEDEETTPRKQPPITSFAEPIAEDEPAEDDADDWEDIDEEREEAAKAALNLDPETLKNLIKQRLREQGVTDEELGTSIRLLAATCSGTDELLPVEAALDQLANSAIEEAADDGGASLSAWLAGETVEPAAADKEDVSESEDGAETEGLDPEILKSILQQRLAESGISTDEGSLMQTLASMLSGGAENSADEAADQLANSLLGRSTEGVDAGFSGWLKQHGVNLEDEDDEEAGAEEEDIEIEMPPESLEARPDASLPKRTKKSLAKHSSPPDSGVSMAEPSPATVATGSRKRKAPSSHEAESKEEKSRTKRPSRLK